MAKKFLIFILIIFFLTAVPVSGIAGPGALDHVVITPEAAKVVIAGTAQFTAKGYDKDERPLADVKFKWSVVNEGGSIDSNGLFAAGLKAGVYENTIQVEATQGNVTKVAYASVTIVKLLDVEVTIGEFPVIDGYLYAFVVENIGIENCTNFTIGYSGDEPVDHSEPPYWGDDRYKAEAGKISWDFGGFSSYDFNPSQQRMFYFTIPEQTLQIEWKAKNTGTGNFDSGSVKTFANTMISPLDIEVQVSEEKVIDGYLYTLLVQNIGEEACNSFSIRYIGGGGVPVDHSEPPYWGDDCGYKAEAGKISWDFCGFSSYDFNPDQQRMFSFTLPEQSLQIEWKAKNTATGNFDFYFGDPPTMEVKASPSSIPPDGRSTSTITATVTSHEGNPVKDEVVVMKLTGDGTLGKVINNGDGAYTATYIAGTTPGTVTITATATNSTVSDTVELMLTSEPVINQPTSYQTELSLTKGVNIISLSLKPDVPWTAKTIVKELGATLVIQAVDSSFMAYIPEGDIGEDFPIEANKGYIVNVVKPVSYTLLGTTWGEPVAAAPSIETENPTWAFIVTGVIERKQSFRTPPNIAMIKNLRTGYSTTAKIQQNGRFIAPFCNLSRRSVIEVDDEIELSFIDRHGNLLSKVIRRIEPEQIERAYLNSVIELRPVKTALFQNYPNPFNPETWIPFQLARPADVTISIYDASSRLIHTLSQGQRPVGFYVEPSKAAYWNGRNTVGEKVASGIYFYQLKAGDFTAIRRMVILK